MTANDLNQQAIGFSGQLYKSLPFTDINKMMFIFMHRTVQWHGIVIDI